MRLDPFQLERYFGQYEFSVPFPLAASDCDGLSLEELLSLADVATRNLWETLRLGYTESQGHPLLRQEIAGLYKDCEPEQVLVAAPEELIFIAMNCLVRNGDHVVCTFPGYQSLYSIAESLHAEVSRWEADEPDGWRFDPDKLAQLIRPSTRLIIVNFPHNPTGSLPRLADYERILEIAAGYGITVFSDEMYRLLERDEGDRLPAAVDLYDKAVSLSGVSKTLGLAGLRIGWLVVRDERLMRRLIQLKDYTTICNSAPSEILALAGLRARDSILARHHDLIERNLGLLDGFMAKYEPLFSWVPPRGGTVCFPRFKPDSLDTPELCRMVREEAGVLLAPSTVFDYGERHLRIGAGRESFPEGLLRLSTFFTSKRAG
ncbi:MAG: aminotransferase class I/II-fold pyridoxal phosphate-dependent enzyme [Thermoleophilia bacterium]